jgi:choline dehydrogenase-like flavoprotein
MCADQTNREFDVVIVGSGVAGALVAKRLGLAGRTVLVLEAGEPIPPNIDSYMDSFFNASAKVPESPYPPAIVDSKNALIDPLTVNAGRPTSLTLAPDIWKDPTKSYLIPAKDEKGLPSPQAFASTYERIAGGTSRHWLGTSLRFLPNDFRMRSTYGRSSALPTGIVDWPIGYSDLEPWYGDAEHEIGVSADADEQAYLGITFPPGYAYPMPSIVTSRVDQFLDPKKLASVTVGGRPLKAYNTPAARNSQPYQNRRVCAGNTNCIPICPIQAKYDPTITLNDASTTRNVTIRYRTVAYEVVIGENGRVSQINCHSYEKDGKKSPDVQVRGKIFVIAANAIETPRLLLMSKNGGPTAKGVANRSDAVGRYLMDHPYYVPWGLAPKPIWPYRGPLSTSGIESARDGAFRSTRGAFRVDIGNDGWSFVVGGLGGDPNITTVDFVNGLNNSKANDKDKPVALFGRELATKLNNVLSRQFRLGFLVEQTPDESNRVTLATGPKEVDGLGLPRPAVHYALSDYTKRGLAVAKQTADDIFKTFDVEQKTTTADVNDPCVFEWPRGSGKHLKYYGAGHIIGTCRMGTDHQKSVVNAELRSWQHPNLFVAGSSVFPTSATANPTLTIAALSLRLAETIKQDLSIGAG